MAKDSALSHPSFSISWKRLPGAAGSGRRNIAFLTGCRVGRVLCAHPTKSGRAHVLTAHWQLAARQERRRVVRINPKKYAPGPEARLRPNMQNPSDLCVPRKLVKGALTPVLLQTKAKCILVPRRGRVKAFFPTTLPIFWSKKDPHTCRFRFLRRRQGYKTTRFFPGTSCDLLKPRLCIPLS